MAWRRLGRSRWRTWVCFWWRLRNPWVITGILCLLGFFASYLTALSWADLTFVLPSTAFGYIVVAFLARFWLHEPITPYRWAGILLIVCGVGFVANGPSLTLHESQHPTEEPAPAGKSAVTGGTQ